MVDKNNATVGENLTFTVNFTATCSNYENVTFSDYLPSYLNVTDSILINETHVWDAYPFRYKTGDTYVWETNYTIRNVGFSNSRILNLNITVQVISLPPGNFANFSNFVNVSANNGVILRNATAPPVIIGNYTTQQDQSNISLQQGWNLISIPLDLS